MRSNHPAQFGKPDELATSFRPHYENVMRIFLDLSYFPAGEKCESRVRFFSANKNYDKTALVSHCSRVGGAGCAADDIRNHVQVQPDTSAMA
jgi:hypothetical protein